MNHDEKQGGDRNKAVTVKEVVQDGAFCARITADSGIDREDSRIILL